jgi:energy-converting hydrogenase Eha subunit A
MKRNQISRVLKLVGIIAAACAGLILLFTVLGWRITESDRPTQQSGISPWEHFHDRQRGIATTRNIGIGLAVLSISTFGAGWIVSRKLTKVAEQVMQGNRRQGL